MKKNGLNRRDFIKTGALSTIAYGTGNLVGRHAKNSQLSSFGDAKNVIFLVSDGMSSGTMALADMVKQQQFGDKTNWIKLYESDRPYHRGLMDMASLDSIVTDSSAAASSWGCGKRINNGGVNWGPNGEHYKTVCQIFREAGKATGLVTTTRITHATPAGFAINMPSRQMEDEIAEQYTERNIDVLLGGGNRHFDPSMRSDGKDLYKILRNKGYIVVRNKRDLSRASKNSRIIGTFRDSHLPYMVDYNSELHLHNAVPTLAEMTRSAIERLGRKPDGFILQIEGGRVDHAAHGNDASGLIYDQIAFDDAIKVVMDYTENRKDTLVIITTDHGNANPGLNGLGSGYRDSPKMLKTLQDYRRSFDWIYDELGYQWPDSSIRGLTVERVQDMVEFATNIQINKEEASMIKQAFESTFKAPFKNREWPAAVLAGVLANYNGIYFVGTNHTADYVEIAAWGPGSDRIPTFVRNTDLFDLMVDMTNVRAYAEG